MWSLEFFDIINYNPLGKEFPCFVTCVYVNNYYKLKCEW